MFLLDHFQVLLKIFYWTGLAPFPTLDIKQQCYCHIISTIVSSLINVGYVVASFYFQLYTMYGNIAKIVNYAYVGSLSLSNLSAYIQCYHYKSVYRKIIEQIIKMEKNFNITFSTKSSFKTVSHRYRLEVCSISILLFISFTLQFYEAWLHYDHKILIIVTFTVLNQFMSALILFHVLLYICIVQMFICELNRRLRNAPICFYPKTKIEFLKTIKLMHMEMWRLMMKINTFFSWNLPFLFIHLTIQATYQSYWIFLIVQVEWNLLYVFGKW